MFQASNNLTFVSFISNSRPKSAAVATISAFFILLRADLEGMSTLAVIDSVIVFTELSAARGVETFSTLDKGEESSSAPFVSSSLLASTESDPLNNLEKKPFFFVSFLSLII